MVKMIVKYTAEIPQKEFDKWVKVCRVGKKKGILILKEAAIEAAEKEINYLVNESIID